MTTAPDRPAYSDPLYYDIAFQEDTEKEAAFIASQITYEAVLNEISLEDVSVFEPMCGSGRLLKRLHWYFGHTSAIDIQDGAIEYVKAWATGFGAARNMTVMAGDASLCSNLAKLFRGHGLLSASYNTINSFREMNVDQAHEHLVSVRKYTEPGGIYILGMHLLPSPLNAYQPAPEAWRGERDGIVVESYLETIAIQPRKRVEHIRLTLEAGKAGTSEHIATTVTELQFTTYTRKQITELFTETGWKIERMFDFGYATLPELTDHTEDVIFILKNE